MLQMKEFEDAIGIFPEFLDGYGVLIIPTTGRYFQVPRGIILPKKTEQAERRLHALRNNTY